MALQIMNFDKKIKIDLHQINSYLKTHQRIQSAEITTIQLQLTEIVAVVEIWQWIEKSRIYR